MPSDVANPRYPQDAVIRRNLKKIEIGQKNEVKLALMWRHS